MPRTRIVLVQQRTRLKNRIHASIAKHGVHIAAVSVLFGLRGRQLLPECLQALPPHTASISSQWLAAVDALDLGIAALERRMQDVFRHTADIELLEKLPGVGCFLAVVIGSEVGDVRRFPCPQEFASYAGTTPRVHASGGKNRYGPRRTDVNRYLK